MTLELAQASGKRRRPGYRLSGDGIRFPGASRDYAAPRFFRDHLIAPVRTFGADTNACLNLSFWHASVEDSPQASDPSFVSASLRTSRATAWRDNQPSGLVSMLPFEGAHWRFEQPVTFMQVHVPFDLMGLVCGSLYDRALSHDDLKMPAAVGDERFHRTLEAIRRTASAVDPTNLMLDSWALILAEVMLGGLSAQAERSGRQSFGRLTAHQLARVVDYVETEIDQDLRLSTLAQVAGMSLYDFARRFRETLGISPHAYVLRRRVARVQAMLARQRSDLAHIALGCGFSSQSHMTTVFRRQLGLTPGAYRRRVS